jgi:hypothetical protein
MRWRMPTQALYFRRRSNFPFSKSRDHFCSDNIITLYERFLDVCIHHFMLRHTNSNLLLFIYSLIARFQESRESRLDNPWVLQPQSPLRLLPRQSRPLQPRLQSSRQQSPSQLQCHPLLLHFQSSHLRTRLPLQH